MRKSIGFGAYDGFGSFGYAEKPEWGLYSPAASLYASDPSIYGSLYTWGKDPGKAWKRSGASSLYAPGGTGAGSNPYKGMTERSSLDGYGEEESTTADTVKAAGLLASPMFLLVAVILAMKYFGRGA